jgi:hypothetical protein
MTNETWRHVANQALDDIVVRSDAVSMRLVPRSLALATATYLEGQPATASSTGVRTATLVSGKVHIDLSSVRTTDGATTDPFRSPR